MVELDIPKCLNVYYNNKDKKHSIFEWRNVKNMFKDDES